MNNTKSQKEIVGRRAELLAELFLQDLGATSVWHAPDAETDFFVAFPNGQGGTNLSTVEVKATERLIDNSYSLDSKQYKRLAHSNIPSLLLVVDAKSNHLHYAWLGEDDVELDSNSRRIRIPIALIDDAAKEQIRERLAGIETPSPMHSVRR